jgi:hypothetical protein
MLIVDSKMYARGAVYFSSARLYRCTRRTVQALDVHFESEDNVALVFLENKAKRT